MRGDFGKLLVERGSHRGPHCLGSYRAVRNRAKAGVDDIGFVQPMRRPYGYYSKEVRDLLGPLTRFLRRRVGGRWDDVYAEVRAVTKGRSAVKLHVVDHLLAAVETRIGIGRNGEWIDRDGQAFDPQCRWRPEFYVDPQTGILCRRECVRRGTPGPVNAVEQKLAAGRTFKKLAGIWYETTPAGGAKRQLSRKELRSLNLANDAA